jgi:uncharacterized membrane protein
MNQTEVINGVLWNCYLAVIPVALAYVILWVSRIRKAKSLRNLLVAGLAIVWLAFLPNTCYLLTEWRHFLFMVDRYNLFVASRYNPDLLIGLCAWSLFYLLYSGFGIVMFCLAIRPMEHLAAKRGATVWFWALPLFVALSLGVYLGLVLRFNSWEPATHPSSIWRALIVTAGRPKLLGMIVIFGIFLWGVYEAVDVWIDGLTERWSRLTGRRIHLGPHLQTATRGPTSEEPG